MTEYSPSKKIVCPSSGPLDAEIVLIGESPAKDEMSNKPGPMPFVGRAGKLLNNALAKAGISRDKCYVMNCVPVRAPKDKFSLHSEEDITWGRQRLQTELAQLTNAKVYVCLGANPTEWLLGGKPPVASYGDNKPKAGFIGEWRGSVIPIGDCRDTDEPIWGKEDYLRKAGLKPTGLDTACIIPTFHPAAVLRQFTWHPWLVMDLEKTAEVVKNGPPIYKSRRWYFDNIVEFNRLVYETKPDLISFDTENDPELVGIATDEEVHVFELEYEFKQVLTDLLSSPLTLKVAHNWLFDYAWVRKKLGISVAKPMFDTLGGAHSLHNGLEKQLSPHISTRYTNWPYHKWLVNHDSRWYNGMDAVVCYDAYWPIINELNKRKLLEVAWHDHRLFTPLLEMQAVGFKIDEVERKKVEQELGQDLEKKIEEIQELAEPIIEKRIGKFQKPKLFRKEGRCKCCSGRGSYCWRCGGLKDKPSKKADYLSLTTPEKFAAMKKSELEDLLPECKSCGGKGKVVKKLPFNPDSPDQVADVVYRGLGIRAKKFKGKETIRQASLDLIKDKHELVGKLVECSQIRADWDTVNRLRAGLDGALHCEFDPWGTGSGRVACKEGLLEPGTNAMNLPKKARKFVVPRDGKIFLYPDMSAIEARAVAVLSGDKKLMSAFMDPIDWPESKYHGRPDCHTRTVQLMKEQGVEINRDLSKIVIYGGFYGGQAKQLAVEANAMAIRKGQPERVTTEQMQVILDTLFKVYNGVDRWRQNAAEEVLRTRKLRCPFTGREREWLGYIYDAKTQGLKHEITKQTWSFLPQHLAAWVLAEGLCEMYYDSGEWGELLQPLIHVHDALLIETPIDRVEEGKALASKILTRTMWGMEFTSEMKVGTNWEVCS